MKPTVFTPTLGAARPGSGNGYDNAHMLLPANALAVEHGHIDDGPAAPDGTPIRSDGMVDNTFAEGGFGDTDSLFKLNIPTATVSEGRVGWHGIDKGQLKFIYPQGSMTPEQIKLMQQNLDSEQNLFMRSK